ERSERPPTVTVSAAGPSSSTSSGTNVAWKFAMNSSMSASGTDASAITPSSAPTGSVSPTAATRRRRTPAAGASTTPLIFSVSTSATSAPWATSAPSSTSHSTSLPSVIDRPHFGTPSFEMVMSAGGRGRADGLPHRGRDAVRPGHVRVLEAWRERSRRMRRRHHPGRGPERREAVLRDERHDVARKRAARIRLVDGDEAAGPFHRLVDRLLVERRRRARVDDLAGDPLGLELGRGGHGHSDHPADRDDGHVVAVADHARLAERDRVRLLRDVALHGVERLVPEEDDGIVVADRLDQEPRRVLRG